MCSSSCVHWYCSRCKHTRLRDRCQTYERDTKLWEWVSVCAGNQNVQELTKEQSTLVPRIVQPNHHGCPGINIRRDTDGNANLPAPTIVGTSANIRGTMRSPYRSLVALIYMVGLEKCGPSCPKTNRIVKSYQPPPLLLA